jgi:hypothetical protein
MTQAQIIKAMSGLTRRAQNVLRVLLEQKGKQGLARVEFPEVLAVVQNAGTRPMTAGITLHTWRKAMSELVRLGLVERVSEELGKTQGRGRARVIAQTYRVHGLQRIEVA